MNASGLDMEIVVLVRLSDDDKWWFEADGRVQICEIRHIQISQFTAHKKITQKFLLLQKHLNPVKIIEMHESLFRWTLELIECQTQKGAGIFNQVIISWAPLDLSVWVN